MTDTGLEELQQKVIKAKQLQQCRLSLNWFLNVLRSGNELDVTAYNTPASSKENLTAMYGIDRKEIYKHFSKVLIEATEKWKKEIMKEYEEL